VVPDIFFLFRKLLDRVVFHHIKLAADDGFDALLAGFGLDLAPEIVAGINAVLIAVLTLLVRGQVSPATAAEPAV